MHRILGASLALFLGGAGFEVRAAASWVISEFLASNGRVLADEDGDYEDWIELRNLSTSTASPGGWYLTDDPELPTKWSLPSTNVAPGGYLVVFASGKDRRVPGGRLHTNFRLNDEGEYLALVQPDGETVASAFAPQYPPQATDRSFGLDAQGAQRFFDPPTPGAANGSGFVAQVEDTKFSVDRGFYDAPFDLAITCATAGAEIRYTTNGTPPTASTGLVYSRPLRIAGTTVLRVAAFRAGWLPSNVDTHTYLFTEDIVRQSPTGTPPPGWPASWGANTRDYGMDPDVVNDPRYRDTIRNDLRTIPSFCISVHLPDLFDPSRGIYANPGQDGRSWERPVSIELVHPDGRDGFQVDGGIRIRGGFSRSTDNPKHAFRFFFRGEYGTPKLRYPLFGDSGTDEFDGFDLRTFQNYSWSFQGDPRGTFLRDQFNRDVQMAMGQPGERGDYYHLYINGQYWGIFNTCERPEASYAESYFGGRKEDYDVIKVEAGPYTTVATDGTMQGWTQLYNLVRGGVDDTLYRRLLGQNPDGTRNPDYPVYVDPENLIDYMLVILWGGNLDAPISNFIGNTSPNNYFGIWNRVTRDHGFRFFVHDAEHTLLDVNADRTGPYPAGDSSVSKSNPQWLWQKLQASAEFRILAADRIQRHLLGTGPLSAAGARELLLRRRNEIDRAVVAESARWGDAKRPNDPMTRDDEWLPAVQQNLDFVARRTAVVLQQLRADGLYPNQSVPQFNQQGGPVPAGFALLMAPGGTTIYYTLDGTDPRRPGGGVAASARAYSAPVLVNESVVVKARTYSEGRWSALNEAEFYVVRTFKELLVTEIHYHPTSTADRDGDDFEFLELKNVGAVALDLSGVTLTNGVSFRFPNGTRLAPGRFAVLVRNPEAFASRYPGVPIAGVYGGRLSNSGERLTLVHAVGTPIFDVRYDTRPPWPAAADGQGFSLVPVQPNLNVAPDDPTQWRASVQPGGSPGADDPTPIAARVVVNEVLAHTDPPLVDQVELHNPTGAAAAIGGWWLSDDRLEPKKFRIPAGTSIPPGGYLVFGELDFNTPAGAPGSFTFSSYGDEVWLSSADAQGNLTGYTDGFAFGASANGVSFGRQTNSVGRIAAVPQITNTLGLPNAGPRLGPVVINEIQYAPFGGEAEFVEVRNLTDLPVALYDLLAPTNTWRLSGIGFAFPTGTTLPPRGFAVVAAADPVTFRARFGIPESVPVFGPFGGSLQDGGETLSLERPDKPDLLPDGSFFVPYLDVDTVTYDNREPWPPAAAGTGASLERRSPVTYADDPAAWRASFGEPSPGFGNDGNRAPLVDAGSDAEFESAVFPVEVRLAGSATDDGLPVAPGRLSFAWSQVEGPGPVEFVDGSVSNAVVRLPGSGLYTLRLTVSDGERTRADDVVVRSARPSERRTLVAAGTSWRYLDDGTDQGSAWRQPAFDDSAWRSGDAQLGFGDGDEKTVLRSSIGGTRTITFYFRRRFDVPDARAINALTVRLVRDDGAMVYLNGQLVFRSNMPEGPVSAATLASEVVGDSNESAFFEQEVDPSVLVSGSNVLAVEVHQQNSGSSDVSFDLELVALANAANRAPTAEAGADFSVPAGEPRRITGRFTDDGLPSPPGVVRLAWRQVEGPATASFDSTQVISPTVTFPAAGRYVLSLTVDDGERSAVDEVVVTATAVDDYASWRARHFSEAELANPAVSGDDADPDGDGQGNRGEYLSGTQPRDASSVLRLRVLEAGDASVKLIVPVVTGRTYSVLRRGQVGSGPWEVQQHLDASQCDCDLEVVVPRSDAEGAYFRVVTPRWP